MTLVRPHRHASWMPDGPLRRPAALRLTRRSSGHMNDRSTRLENGSTNRRAVGPAHRGPQGPIQHEIIVTASARNPRATLPSLWIVASS